MSKNNGGQAFPCPATDSNYFYEGMELRDYFAAKALQGWLASYGESDKHPAMNGSEHTIAIISYQMADAMLEARNK